MLELTNDYIRQNVAYSDIIFHRGTRLYENGAFACVESDTDNGRFVYNVDGNYGDYTAFVNLEDEDMVSACDCPFPEEGCKHSVAVLMDVHDRMGGWKRTVPSGEPAAEPVRRISEPYLTSDEIEAQAMKDREKRSRLEQLQIIEGDMYKGEHIVQTPRGRQYVVTLHDPANQGGHCSCPDFETNRLGVCKHMLFL